MSNTHFFYVCRSSDRRRSTLITPKKDSPEIAEIIAYSKKPVAPNTVEELERAFGPPKVRRGETGAEWELPGPRRIRIGYKIDGYSVQFDRTQAARDEPSDDVSAEEAANDPNTPAYEKWPDPGSPLLNPVALSQYLGQPYPFARAQLYKDCLLSGSRCSFSPGSSVLSVTLKDTENTGKVSQIWWQVFSLSLEGRATWDYLRSVSNTFPCSESDWQERVNGDPTAPLGEGKTLKRRVSCESSGIRFDGEFDYFSSEGNNSVTVEMTQASP
jgi:hypothetical protein